MVYNLLLLNIFFCFRGDCSFSFNVDLSSPPHGSCRPSAPTGSPFPSSFFPPLLSVGRHPKGYLPKKFSLLFFSLRKVNRRFLTEFSSVLPVLRKTQEQELLKDWNHHFQRIIKAGKKICDSFNTKMRLLNTFEL